MLNLLDIADRIQKGPKMEENAWNMALFKKMNELTEEYNLKYPGDDVYFNTDDKIADKGAKGYEGNVADKFRAQLKLTESEKICVNLWI